MEKEEKARASWDTSAMQSKWLVKWLQKVTPTPEVVAAFLKSIVCFFFSFIDFVSTEINISS